MREMHANHMFRRLLAATFLSTFIALQMSNLAPASAVAPVKADKNAEKEIAADAEKPAAPKKDLTAPVLANLAREYKDAPDDLTWSKYFTYLRDLLVGPDFAQANPADLIAANPSLNDLHVKVIDAGARSARVWTFPSINECRGVIFAAPGHVTAIPLPQATVLRDARIIPAVSAPVARPVVAKGHARVAAKGGARGHAAPAPAAEPAAAALSAAGRFLVLLGGDRQTNALWLKSYRLTEGPLVEAPELFASLPAFFSQNVTGKACFSGSDIVLTVQPPTGPAAAVNEGDTTTPLIQSNGKPLVVKTTNTAVAGYKVVLKYLGGKFGLAGRLPDDAPLSVAMAFAQNVCAGRADIAKSWLIDPKLISIPKYLGLIGKSNTPMRLVAMSSGSGSRYRMITAAKNDMIIEVGRVGTPGRLKGQLAVKALFVAPSDSYASKMTGALITPKAEEKAAVDEDLAKAEGAAKNAATKGGAAKAPAPKAAGHTK